MAIYQSDLTPEDSYVALIKGDIQPGDDVLVRIHRECFLGDFMGSELCDCGRKLKQAREIITNEGKGLVLYIRPSDSAAGFKQNNGYHCCAQASTKAGSSVSEALMINPHELNCAVSAKILADLGITSVRPIISESEINFSFQAYGVDVKEQVIMEVF